MTPSNTKVLGTDFAAMMDEAKKLATDGENENILVIVAKADGNFHVLTDIETPLTITLQMMQGAAKAIFAAKKDRVQQTLGAPEIVES